MKTVSAFTQTAWESGDYTGERRPAVRATIHRWFADRSPYNFWLGESITWRHNGHYTSCLFNQPGRIRELFNVKSIKISRGVDTDVATCQIELYNVQWKGDNPNPREEEFDYPGWFTPNRGENDEWDYGSNVWKNWLLPDRIIKTFEGYGIDKTVAPELDEYMYPSGVWLIDDVSINTQGTITLQCRDLGRLLLDHIMYPPLVPFDVYPLYWEKFDQVPNDWDWDLTDFELPTYRKDSNELVLAAGLMDGDLPAVAVNGKVRGHEGAHAVDGDAGTYWLSAGSSDPNQLEWIEFDVADKTVEGIKINARGGPHAVYISLYHKTKGWRGAARIPYEVAEDGTDLDARIKYVRKGYLPLDSSPKYINLPRTFKNITRIRLTFAPRWQSGIGERRFRIGVQEFRFAQATERVEGTGTNTRGNYEDYTDIVKWLTAWTGWYWPNHAKVRYVDKQNYNLQWVNPDPVLAKGRAWGDFMQTGTAGVTKLTVDMFDKKPVMDGIAAVREIVGFEFWIDETGAVIWRLPNIWKRGNYLMPEPDQIRRRTQNILTIDESTTLVDLRATLSSKNVREQIFVADVNGNFGVAVKGFNPAPSNQRRVGGWTDQHFRNRAETRRVAELIAVRSAMTYRRAEVTIAANPAIQIDDQVIIKERMTGEGYMHRVMAISSEFDVEVGKWTYTLTTQWLGDEAFTENAWKPELSPLTNAFLNNLDQA
jgi:hypothetical protein